MIPKKIHYCWFGRGEKPKLAQKCIASWKKFCPDYEIIEWNEDNFDVNFNEYTRFTYEHRLYAYLSDYVRLWVVEQFGGIYFDTDVELICSPQDLLVNDAYFGFESNEFINTGIGFGAVAHHPAVQAMLHAYNIREKKEFESDYNQSRKLKGSPRMNTYALTPYGLIQNGSLQNVCGAVILPAEYLCPYDDVTGETNITEHSISIHWYSKSANSKLAKVKVKFSRPLHRFLKKIRNH